MTAILLSLYASVIVPILSEWIDDESLCCVDCAVCNHEVRSVFLENLAKCWIQNTLSDKTDNEYYDWVILRGISLKTMKIKSGMFKICPWERVGRLLKSRHLISLESTAQFELMVLAENTVIVDSLKLYSYTTDVKIEAILVALGPHLTSLDISHCSGFSDAVYSKIAGWCPALKHFRASAGGNVRAVAESLCLDSVGQFDLAELLNQERLGMKCTLERVETSHEGIVLIGGKHYAVCALNVCAEPSFSRLLKHDDIHRSLRLVGLKCSHLTSLSVSGECFERAIFEIIQFASGTLTHVDASRMSFEFKELIPSCSELTSVKVDGSMVQAVYEGCPKLCRIESSYIQQDSILFVVKNYHSITLTCRDCVKTVMEWKTHRDGRHFHCSTSFRLKDPGFAELFVQNPELVRINIDYGQKIRMEEVTALVEHCPLLESVKIDALEVSEEMVDLIVGQCKRLTALHLVAAPCGVITADITGDDAAAGSSCSLRLPVGMMKVALPLCAGFCGERLLHSLAAHYPSIKQVDVSHNHSVTSAGVVALLSGCVKLHHLNLEGCSLVTSDMLKCLRDHYCGSSGGSRQMRYLNVKRSGIEPEEMKEFVQSTGFRCTQSLLY